nr:ACP phosphodiesterase [Cytophagales bacterium]
MKLLHIMASPRGEKSRTLTISNEFLTTLKLKYPNLTIEELDLFQVKLPEVYGNTVDAKYALMAGGILEEQSKASWEEISNYSNEFLSYDAFLISCPMWNFTIPYKLKHYIDVIMQAGILFNFTANGVEGLASNKKMYCITSRGNDYSENSPMHQFDFQEPYLRAIFGLAGIFDISFINSQPMDFTHGITLTNLSLAKEQAVSMAQHTVL